MNGVKMVPQDEDSCLQTLVDAAEWRDLTPREKVLLEQQLRESDWMLDQFLKRCQLEADLRCRFGGMQGCAEGLLGRD